MKKSNTACYVTCLFMACTWLCFAACTNPMPVTVQMAKSQIVEQPATVVNDSVQVKKSIVDFLKWYKVNLNKANNFPILVKDSCGNYEVSKKAYKDYLNYLLSSKLVSTRYAGYWETYFKDKANELKDNPIQSDVPEGFDFDFILITQEPELILNRIDRMKLNIVSMSDSVAMVSLKIPNDDTIEYEFEMYKSKAGWQIGYIATPNYD